MNNINQIVENKLCVSCCSCKVPCVPILCTSWSHKYQELVTAMGCHSSCLDMHDIKSSLEIVEDSFIHPELYTASNDSRQKWKTDVERMWDEVLKCDL